MTVAIEMGHTTAGAPATLDLEDLLATRLLVQGNSGSGKSHLLRRLLEQSAAWVQQTIIDPEGDFVALSDRFGRLLIDAEDHTERGLQVAGERARIHRVSTGEPTGKPVPMLLRGGRQGAYSAGVVHREVAAGERALGL